MDQDCRSKRHQAKASRSKPALRLSTYAGQFRYRRMFGTHSLASPWVELANRVISKPPREDLALSVELVEAGKALQFPLATGTHSRGHIRMTLALLYPAYANR